MRPVVIHAGHSHKFPHKRKYTFKPGLTVLVGGHGSGKTSVLKLIADAKAGKYDSTVVEYTGNKSELNQYVIDRLCDGTDPEFLPRLYDHKGSYGQTAALDLRAFFTRAGKLLEETPHKEVWITLDDHDWAVSADELVSAVDEHIPRLTQAAKDRGIELFVVMAASRYESAADRPCLVMSTGRYKTYKSLKPYLKDTRSEP